VDSLHRNTQRLCQLGDAAEMPDGFFFRHHGLRYTCNYGLSKGQRRRKMTHTELTPACDVDLTAIMTANRIRSISSNPDWHSNAFTVYLDCGGHAGVGKTVGEALADAMEKNADYLEMKRD
jgi:hypothetical protein